MKLWRGKAVFAAELVFIMVVCSITGCVSPFSDKEKGAEPLSISGFAFDTTYTVTLYQGGSRKLLDHCVSLCTDYEKLLSTTRKDSELYQINKVSREAAESGEADGSVSVKISDQMHDILQKGLYYCKLSDGNFDISIDPVSSLWDFSSGKGTVPDAQKIKEAREQGDLSENAEYDAAKDEQRDIEVCGLPQHSFKKAYADLSEIRYGTGSWRNCERIYRRSDQGVSDREWRYRCGH